MSCLAFTQAAAANIHTVAVRYVALRESAKAPARPTKAQVRKLLGEMSRVWSRCGVKFVLEDYQTPAASELGLPLSPAGSEDRHRLRRAFATDRYALYIATRKWNRASDPHDDGSNAFSSVPNDGVQGVVFEDWVATSSVLLSHEFGHLGGNLDDIPDDRNLMNHVVSDHSLRLTDEQCEKMKATLASARRGWLR